jgi:copper chaperone
MLELHIPDMSCGHCRKAIQNAVEGVDQSASVEFDMEPRHATVKSNTDAAILIKALAEAGYPATEV